MSTAKRNAQIFQEYSAGGVTYKDLAKKYGLSAQTVSRIVMRARLLGSGQDPSEPFLGLSARAGNFLRHQGFKTEDEAREKLTWKMMCDALNVGRKTADEICEYLGLDLKPKLPTDPGEIALLKHRAEKAEARVKELEKMVALAERMLTDVQGQVLALRGSGNKNA